LTFGHGRDFRAQSSLYYARTYTDIALNYLFTIVRKYMVLSLPHWGFGLDLSTLTSSFQFLRSHTYCSVVRPGHLHSPSRFEKSSNDRYRLCSGKVCRFRSVMSGHSSKEMNNPGKACGLLDNDSSSSVWVLFDTTSKERYRDSVALLDQVVQILASRDDSINRSLHVAVWTGCFNTAHDANARKEDVLAFPTLWHLDILSNILYPCAKYAPMMDLVPVFDQLIPSEPDLQDSTGFCERSCVFVVSTSISNSMEISNEFISRCCRGDTVPPVTEFLAMDFGQQQQKEGTRVLMSSSRLIIPSDLEKYYKDIEVNDMALNYSTVAVGGTFDRVHAGHRLLLGATAMVTNESVFVGITSDKLLQNKSHKEKLQSYAFRSKSAVSYMENVNPKIHVTPGPLTDPLEPPLCATEENFTAIVVSEETVSGAHEINRVRRSLGFSPLVIIVVGLLYSHAGNEGAKLSSSDLRVLESTG
jgi:phosphopantetheine adenylyltransferase